MPSTSRALLRMMVKKMMTPASMTRFARERDRVRDVNGPDSMVMVMNPIRHTTKNDSKLMVLKIAIIASVAKAHPAKAKTIL